MSSGDSPTLTPPEAVTAARIALTPTPPDNEVPRKNVHNLEDAAFRILVPSSAPRVVRSTIGQLRIHHTNRESSLHSAAT